MGAIVSGHNVSIEAVAFYEPERQPMGPPATRRAVGVQATCSCGWESAVGPESIVTDIAKAHEAAQR